MIIPFFIPHAGCPHQCLFCDQKKITGIAQQPDPLSVPRIIENCLATSGNRGDAQVAFFGGSFTALSLSLQQAYLDAVRPFIASGRVRGIRVSTRPDAVSEEIAERMQRYGVTIVELGAQSMNDAVLAASRRGHTSSHTAFASAILKQRSFGVGIQLMPGLPGEGPDEFLDVTVRRVIELRPDFVRLYPALVLAGTPLEDRYRAGTFRPLSLDAATALCGQALERFRSAGIEVIRIGLQPTEELSRQGTVVAGPYHPAFRQLVESSLFLERMRLLLRSAPEKRQEASFVVNPSDLSSAIGQKRSNITRLQEEFRIRNVTIRGDAAVPRHTVQRTDLPFPPSPAVV